MDTGTAAYLIRHALGQVLLISAPILLISLLVGLVVSIVQAAFSVQEQTLSFVPKILAVLVVVIIFGAWMFGSMEQFALEVFRLIPRMVK
ncbi:MAG: flagellar biosynthesis protein FliQ [Spirochaetia bacterium]|nr:flagellar biosynthesis protein FliQ [Spirochaetia bacterium]MBQ3648141.1 flagellar biosynthesis protein FliQ [Spirochaetia bacterium]MBQ3713876.1 flagellar biosynthesis protein FliQ [Spirochaetia bacterium]MBQ6673350.1 flagellar biosynthesis protein FliQ [Spirochaetia bacterium]MBQ6905294.1 flagellar biosynthesis protein FliQ [Spirochaetia bacterium]